MCAKPPGNELSLTLKKTHGQAIDEGQPVTLAIQYNYQ